MSSTADVVLWEIIIQNTTPYTRWCLCMCTRWFGTRCVTVSMEHNIALGPVIYTPELIRMNVFLGYMNYGDRHDAKDIVRVYNGADIQHTYWTRDYHLMMRLRPESRLESHLCAHADLDVIEFDLAKLDVDKFKDLATDSSRVTVYAANLIHRDMHASAAHLLDMAYTHYEPEIFMQIICDIAVFMDADVRREYNDKYSLNAIVGINTITDSFSRCLRGITDNSVIPEHLYARHVHAAAYGGHVDLVASMYRDGVKLLTEIWNSYNHGLITEEIFIYACEHEPGAIADEMIIYANETTDECFKLALGYVTDSNDIGRLIMGIPSRIDTVIQHYNNRLSHKQIKPLTNKQHKKILWWVSSHAERSDTFDAVLQLLAADRASINVYYKTISRAADTHLPAGVIIRLAQELERVHQYSDI